MAKHSTAYIFGFAGAVCLVCALFVSASVVLLKDRQEENKVLDKQKKVLAVAGFMEEGEDLSSDTVKSLFAENIEAKIIRLEDGSYIDVVDTTKFDQRKAGKDPKSSSVAPPNPAKVARVPNNAMIYQVVKDGKVKRLILPIEGKGLWSTLYGFLALESDARTISGITFYEHGETPGLGGEVDNPQWKSLWKNRKAFESDQLEDPAIQVVKGAAGPPTEDPHRVDGLSGATITSRGVSHLVRFWLGDDGFGPYLREYKEKEAS